MIPVSIGKVLVDYIRLWAKGRNTLKDGVMSVDEFFTWETGILVDINKTHHYYRTRYFDSNPEKFCDQLSEKLKEPVKSFLIAADFKHTEVTVHITFRYVGKTWLRNVKVSPAYSLN